MNVLVTAGNTKVSIDRVRCITNIFSGRTGAAIALHAHERGHRVTVLTSRPEAIHEAAGAGSTPNARWTMLGYETFEDLQNLMADQITAGRPDVVIHCAAVSDHLVEGVYGPAPGTRFDVVRSAWEADCAPPALLDRAAGKVKSDEPELWLRLVRAPKLIDQVRAQWGFRGVLVKFKLEVGRTDAELLEVAERSRQMSAADLVVANTLEDVSRHAFLGPLGGEYQKVSRAELPERLLDAIGELARSPGNG